MATTKKHVREAKAYVGYLEAVEEEFGDVLWYFTALCRRLGIDAEEVLSRAVTSNDFKKKLAASDLKEGPISEVYSQDPLPSLDEALTGLGKAIANLLDVEELNPKTEVLLQQFARSYLQALQLANARFSKVVRMNIKKTRGRFLDWNPEELPTFDTDFPTREQLPYQFEISISQQSDGRSYLRWNGRKYWRPFD